MMVSLKIHSVVNIITNSSTVVFTQATQNTITTVKAAIDALLKMAGYDKSADDLFTFSIEINPGAVKDWRMNQMPYPEGSDDMSWQEIGYAQEKQYQRYESGKDEKPEWWDDYASTHDYFDLFLIVESKEENEYAKVAAEALSKIMGTLDGDGYYS